MRSKLKRAWLLLPPAIHKKIEAETPLSSGLLRAAIQRVQADPGRTIELRETADRIIAHLRFFPAGWGEWPQSSGECLYIGTVLGTWVTRDIDQQLLAMPEEQLAFLEHRCREDGIEVEECLLNLLIEARGE
jgi:hypothetical protein